MRTKIYEERTKEEIEIERQRLDAELTYQVLLNEHLANQLKEKEEKKMKNKLKKVFTKKEKEKVIDYIITEAYLGNEVELNNEQARELANEVIKKENKWYMIGLGLGAVTALLAVYALSDND